MFLEENIGELLKDNEAIEGEKESFEIIMDNTDFAKNLTEVFGKDLRTYRLLMQNIEGYRQESIDYRGSDGLGQFIFRPPVPRPSFD